LHEGRLVLASGQPSRELLKQEQLTELVAMNNEQGSNNKHSKIETTLQIFDIILSNLDDHEQTLASTPEKSRAAVSQ
jgi:hypothetical protein